MFLTGTALKDIICQVATNNGPRPAGHPAEADARSAIENRLRAAGITDLESLPFTTADTWGYGTVIPTAIALLAALLPLPPIISAAVSLFAAHQFWMTLRGQLNAHLLWPLVPKRPSATLVARIPPDSAILQRVVLIGHVDSNKQRASFSPTMKRWMRASSTLLLVSMIAYAPAVLLGWFGLQLLAAAVMVVGLVSFFMDEVGGYVEGANDNGSALACVLGVGSQAAANRLNHTELWLAFTGEEEVTHQGLNTLLDRYGDVLWDAMFIDFEMVGKGSIHYATRQSGLVMGTAYTPDTASLTLAEQTAQAHPELGVSGRDILILDEVATLRRRGFRGIGLDGVDADGFPANWHQKSDILDNIDPKSLESAARFAWAMIEAVDNLTLG